jgi:hypothetical protein
VPRLQSKSFAKPDRARNLGSGRVDLVDLDETVVGRVTLPAGWRWSKDVRPVVQTISCQTRHVSYAMGGILHVAMDDGTELEPPLGSRPSPGRTRSSYPGRPTILSTAPA